MGIEGTKRILLAEEEPIIALNFEMALEDAGYSVVGPVHTREAALELARHERIDCAVLDIDLEGVDSVPVLAALRRRGIPVVITTGLSRGDMESPLFRGTPILLKPFPTEELVRELSRLLVRSDAARDHGGCIVEEVNS